MGLSPSAELLVISREGITNTTIMIGGWSNLHIERLARWPYVVCNSIRCTLCLKWVHKICSGVSGSLNKKLNLCTVVA